MAEKQPTNEKIADALSRIAELLEMQEEDQRFRVQAYRKAAQRVRGINSPLTDLLQRRGQKALEAIPDIGEGIASVITEFVHTGESSLLQDLRGEVAPETLFADVPGIGKELARRIVEQLDVHSLEELEQAAHDGRLAEVEGFGPERVEGVKVSLAGMLSGAAQRRLRRAGSGKSDTQLKAPDVGTLLDVDEEYRRKAEAGELRTIAPKRFNPENEAWLPILNTERGDWQFTALFSNTARAHELGKTDDWVVLYYERDDREDQATVVTETHGPLEGKRVVRGREDACRRYYERQEGGSDEHD
jgi:NAD-dependent DNA ligase